MMFDWEDDVAEHHGVKGVKIHDAEENNYMNFASEGACNNVQSQGDADRWITSYFHYDHGYDDEDGEGVFDDDDDNDKDGHKHHKNRKGGHDKEDHDDVRGGRYDDTLQGNYQDELYGKRGNDILNTSAGEGENTLHGGKGDDTLIGGINDELHGDKGDDLLLFLRGGNIAEGGEGEDMFQVATYRLPDEANTVTDFKPGEDLVVIKEVRGINSFDDLTLTEENGNLIISYEDQTIAVLENVTAEDISEDNFVITPETTYNFEVDPNDFQDEDGNAYAVDNSYFPRLPGSHYVYEGLNEDDKLEHIEIDILTDEAFAETDFPQGWNEILGVKTTVMRDRVYEDGVLVEDTFDYFAQDKDGNVWYFGEDVINYNYDEEGNLIDTDSDGSWRAGEDGAMPGMYMFANPSDHVGEAYYQEFYAGEAEDAAQLVAADQMLEVLGIEYENVVLTLDYTPIDSESVEFKYYVSGIGPVKIQHLIKDTEFNLVSYTPAS
ncbi:MAG: hypothetical protein H6908_05695 [Hyphomicrobiales bacterium]|nr:hypothetical protein [Hyphomicrobiales bacterium]